MKFLSRLFLLCFALFNAQSAFAQDKLPLSEIFCNLPGQTFADVESEARRQADRKPYYKSNAEEELVFEGYFRPTDATAQLAVFSDDGVDVYINGTKVHSAKGQGQPLPDLSKSLYALSAQFSPDKAVKIRVEFSNIKLTSDTDIDGVTLFAYAGGGQIVTPQGRWVHDRWIGGKMSWSYDEKTLSQQPSATPALEVIRWEDPVAGTVKSPRQIESSYTKTGDETLKFDTEDKTKWVRRVTFRAASRYGALNHTLIDEKNYCSCFRKGPVSDQAAKIQKNTGEQEMVTMALPAVPLLVGAVKVVINRLAMKALRRQAYDQVKTAVREQLRENFQNAVRNKWLTRSQQQEFAKDIRHIDNLLNNSSWTDWLIDCVDGLAHARFVKKLMDINKLVSSKSKKWRQVSKKAEKLSQKFMVGRHGSMPSPRGGRESHHGVMSEWVRNHYDGYKANDAPAILMPRKNHNATRALFNRWRAYIARRDGSFQWSRITEPEMMNFARRQMDAASVPGFIREQYWPLYRIYVGTLTRK